MINPQPRQPHRDAASWSDLIAAIDQDAMIALIGSWMGADLRRNVAPEDIWQETLAMAWRDRHAHEWRSVGAFRGWLRAIARNRIHDTAERVSAKKRGGSRRTESISGSAGKSADEILPPITTTPSREAHRHERASALRAALDSLSDEYRDLVRMCLFEEMSVPAAAKLLCLADSTAYRRLFRGAEMFRLRVQATMESESQGEASTP